LNQDSGAYFGGWTPLSHLYAAYCFALTLHTAYDFNLALRTAFRLTTKTFPFCVPIYIKKIEIQFMACTGKLILANLSYLCLLDSFPFFSIPIFYVKCYKWRNVQNRRERNECAKHFDFKCHVCSVSWWHRTFNIHFDVCVRYNRIFTCCVPSYRPKYCSTCKGGGHPHFVQYYVHWKYFQTLPIDRALFWKSNENNMFFSITYFKFDVVFVMSLIRFKLLHSDNKCRKDSIHSFRPTCEYLS